MSLYHHVPHPRALNRPPPTETAAVLPVATPAQRFNTWLALKVTKGVGSMWCAYIFAVIALIGLPAAIRNGTSGIVQWIAQTFLQLVLLSVIIVGQNVLAAASDKRADATWQDASATLHECLQLQAHLEAQDAVLERLIAHAGGASGERLHDPGTDTPG